MFLLNAPAIIIIMTLYIILVQPLDLQKNSAVGHAESRDDRDRFLVQAI